MNSGDGIDFNLNSSDASESSRRSHVGSYRCRPMAGYNQGCIMPARGATWSHSSHSTCPCGFNPRARGGRDAASHP